MRLNLDVRPVPLTDEWKPCCQTLLRLVHEGAYATVRVEPAHEAIVLSVQGQEIEAWFGIEPGFAAFSELMRGWIICSGGLKGLLPRVETSKPNETTHYFLRLEIEPESDRSAGLFRGLGRILEFAHFLEKDEIEYLLGLAARLEETDGKVKAELARRGGHNG